MNAEELFLYEAGDALVKFRPNSSFVVDGVVYNWLTATVISQNIVGYKDSECACYLHGDGTGWNDCSFGYGADDNVPGISTITSEAYRWKPGMVYYRPVPTEPYRKGE